MTEIIPINDSKQHDEGGMCHCYPQIEFYNGEMIIIHNSYDGREEVEQVKYILNEEVFGDNWITKNY